MTRPHVNRSGRRPPVLPALALALALQTACATPPSPSADVPGADMPGAEAPGAAPTDARRRVPVVRHWGAMRDVLRDGRTEGRVDLAEVLGPNTVAVGATSGLAAEITVVAGEAHLAEVVDPGSADGLRVRAPDAGEEAALLVLAQVAEWSEHALPPVPDLATLEGLVRAAAAANRIDVTRPFPFRVEGVASSLRMHVLDHSCPIADPDGPEPWRFAGSDEAAHLIGFYAEDSAGRLTHHGQASHVHALLTERGLSGHLDAVAFAAGARVFLPVR